MYLSATLTINDVFISLVCCCLGFKLSLVLATLFLAQVDILSCLVLKVLCAPILSCYMKPKTGARWIEDLYRFDENVS